MKRSASFLSFFSFFPFLFFNFLLVSFFALLCFAFYFFLFLILFCSVLCRYEKKLIQQEKGKKLIYWRIISFNKKMRLLLLLFSGTIIFTQMNLLFDFPTISVLYVRSQRRKRNE